MFACAFSDPEARRTSSKGGHAQVQSPRACIATALPHAVRRELVFVCTLMPPSSPQRAETFAPSACVGDKQKFGACLFVAGSPTSTAPSHQSQVFTAAVACIFVFPCYRCPVRIRVPCLSNVNGVTAKARHHRGLGRPCNYMMEGASKESGCAFKLLHASVTRAA